MSSYSDAQGSHSGSHSGSSGNQPPERNRSNANLSVIGYENPFERLPPHSTESEQAVLGGLLIDPQAFNRIIEFLKPEYFYRNVHRVIYEACLDLYNKGEPVDILVNGKPIAKGEVVVIDESFGVRITDIIHPSKRL